MTNLAHPNPNVKALKMHDKVLYALITVFNVFICLMARAESDQVKGLEADPLIDECSPHRWALATDAIHSTSRDHKLHWKLELRQAAQPEGRTESQRGVK